MLTFLSAMLAIALAGPDAGHAATSSPCAEGTRLVLRTRGRTASPPRIVSIGAGGWDVTTDDDCFSPASPRLRARPQGVGVRIGWAPCDGGTAATTRFVGRVTRDCQTLRGVWRVKSPKRVERVTGHPSQCGDGVWDDVPGEECDGADGQCATALVCSASCLCEDPALPIDASFGTGGTVTIEHGEGRALAVDAAGRTLVGVYESDGAGSLAIQRRSVAGQPDVTFPSSVVAGTPATPRDGLDIVALADGGFLTNVGAIRRWDTNGARVVPFGVDGELPTALAIRELDDGRLATFNGSHGLRRHLADGTPDPSFTLVPSPVPAESELLRATFLDDGRLVFLVQRDDPAGSGSSASFVALRVLTDGTLDTGYGEGGLLAFQPYAADYDVVQVLALADDSVLVRSVFRASPAQYSAKRLAADGTDVSTWPAGNGPVARDAAGRVLVAKGVVPGNATVLLRPRLALERRFADGTLDATFGPSGTLLTAFQGQLCSQGRSLCVACFGVIGLPDGRILVGAEGQLVRLQP